MDDWILCECGCGAVFIKWDKYGRERKYVSGHNGRKYGDPTQYKREWNHRNRKLRYQWKLKTYRKKKILLIEQRAGKCQSNPCPWNSVYNGKNAAIFHFHHLDPSTKEFNLGNQLMNKAWETILREAEKCAMICANCHELKHSGEF